MSGWGSIPWGSGPWGSGDLDPSSAATERFNLAEVNVWAADLLELVFSTPAKNNSTLRTAASYSVLPQDSGITVTVRSVRTGTTVSTTRVFLVISPATPGACYDVSVVGNVRSTYDNVLTAPVAQAIKYHRTKIDSVLSMRPTMYDLRAEAVYRNLLNAIGYQDHLIGGNILSCEED